MRASEISRRHMLAMASAAGGLALTGGARGVWAAQAAQRIEQMDPALGNIIATNEPIRQLATGRWIEEHHNVILVGATGVGKSFLACALAHQACRKGYRAGYRRASRLFHELALARADGTYVRLLAKLARLDVLVIDDWGLAPVQDPERRDLLEILEDRYGTRSTIITSQLPPAQWHDYLADATLADAICDRLLHNAHRIVLQGPSRRKETKLDS